MAYCLHDAGLVHGSSFFPPQYSTSVGHNRAVKRLGMGTTTKITHHLETRVTLYINSKKLFRLGHLQRKEIFHVSCMGKYRSNLVGVSICLGRGRRPHMPDFDDLHIPDATASRVIGCSRILSHDMLTAFPWLSASKPFLATLLHTNPGTKTPPCSPLPVAWNLFLHMGSKLPHASTETFVIT